MNTDYTIQHDTPIIYMFARDSEGKRVTLQCSTFTPYFYAPSSEVAERKFMLEDSGITNTHHHAMTLDGEDVVRLETKLPRDVRPARGLFSSTYEADILFPWRYLIDKGIRAGITLKGDTVSKADDNPKIGLKLAYLDTEIESFDQIPDMFSAPNMILCVTIAMVDVTTGVTSSYHTWTATTLEEEKTMLRDIIQFFIDEDPDTIIGWNIAFDLFHLCGRMKHHGIYYNALSPMNYVDLNFQKGKVRILGRSVLDQRDAYKKFFQGKTLESYKLDDIVARKDKYGLGEEREDFDYSLMHPEHIDVIVPYNIRDVKKMMDLEKKFGITNHFDSLRRTAGCPLPDALVTTKYADFLFLRDYNGIRVLPTRRYGREREAFEGAKVFPPSRGIFDNVVLCDFSGMYPSAIISNNISPETMIEGETDEPVHEIAGVKFLKEPQGVVPQSFQKMVDLRKTVKVKMKDVDPESSEWKILWDQQYSLKQCIAAMYGYFAYPNSRLYYPRISSSTTHIGRSWITTAFDMLAGRGYEPIYGDTDSVFIKVEGDPVEAGRDMSDWLNKYFQRRAEKEGWQQTPTMDMERVFSKMLFSGKKKRYAGLSVWPNEEVTIKGFETRRSDSAGYSRDIQPDLLNLMLYGETEKAIRQVTLDYVDKVPNGSITEVGIPKPLRMEMDEYKTPANYLGVFYANQHLGKKFGKDTRPYIFWVKRVPEGKPANISLEGKSYKVTNVALENDEDLNEWRPYIDWDLQAKKIIHNKVESILRAFGLSMSEIMSGQKQQTLEEWT